MTMRGVALLLLAVVAAPGGARTAAQPAEAPAARPTQPGLLCMWARMSAAAQVGRHCRAGQNPALQTELEASLTRIEAHVTRAGMPPADIVTFRNGPGMVTADAAELCTGEPIIFHDRFVAAGPEGLRAETDRLLALPGPPGWGNCH